jgi:hypothetical protein
MVESVHSLGSLAAEAGLAASAPMTDAATAPASSFLNMLGPSSLALELGC